MVNKKRFDVTDLMLQYKERGGRLYITFNGYIVSNTNTDYETSTFGNFEGT